MTWFKNQADMCTNGKVAEAGPDGALVYLSLLCLHTKKGANGTVPASCCKPIRLRTEAVAFLGTFEPDRINNAIEACVRAELCARRADGAIELRGWSNEHAVACSHCRKPNPEPSHKTCPDCREKRMADRQASNGKGARKSRAPRANGAHMGADGARVAALDSDSDSDKSVPPYPPLDTRGERADARGVDRSAREPEAEPERGESSAAEADSDPVVQLQFALQRTGYRSGIASPLQRRFELGRRASELVATGLTPPDVSDLCDLAQAKSNGDPGALLAHWLDENLWREVLDEWRGKAKQLAAKARAKPTDDTLDGTYGGSEPRLAGSMIGDALNGAKGGGS